MYLSYCIFFYFFLFSRRRQSVVAPSRWAGHHTSPSRTGVPPPTERRTQLYTRRPRRRRRRVFQPSTRRTARARCTYAIDVRIPPPPPPPPPVTGGIPSAGPDDAMIHGCIARRNETALLRAAKLLRPANATILRELAGGGEKKT